MATAQDSSLAHCVSADLQMSGGITPAFKKLCGGFETLKKQGSKNFFFFFTFIHCLIKMFTFYAT